MKLSDTVQMMNSADYKERFKAEYWQTKIRYDKLHRMTVKYEAGTLDFEPDCELSLLLEQKKYMGLYLNRLEVRAEVEGIGLEALKDGSETGNHPCAYQAPTLTPPNEDVKDKNVLTNGPLTLEELRLMIEPTPVWWDWVQGWVLARKGMIISWNGVYYNFEEVKGNFYRRPPEGEEENP